MASVNSAPVKTTNINVTPRVIDFVSRFSTEFAGLKEILGVSAMIPKAAGTKLTVKTAAANTGLETSPAEGVAIDYTNYNITESEVGTLTIEKYRTGVTLEAIQKYGYDVAVVKTDDQFLVDLQSKISTGLFTSLNGFATGSETGSTWQMALAKAKAGVVEEMRKAHKSAAGVVAWVNINDFYEWEGAAQITMQTLFGLNYVENFMGYSKVFLCTTDEIAKGKVIATAINNLDVYYVDAAQSDFSKAGLAYYTDGEANLIGVHTEGNYGTAVSDTFAIMGISITPEFANAVVKVTVGE